MKETVLLYNLDKTEAGKAIVSLLKQLNIEVKIIKTKDLMNPLGYLLELDDYNRSNERIKSVPQDDFIVFAGLEEKQIEIILEIFQKANIPYIPLKGIVTDDNIKWSFLQLLNNVKAEYMHLTGMNKDLSML